MLADFQQCLDLPHLLQIHLIHGLGMLWVF
jgi:hypothetical protein